MTIKIAGINGKCDEDNGEEDLPKCDGSYQDCVTDDGYTCEAGSSDHECEIDDEEYAYAEEEEETANCGGEPCTPTEKEDSWLDDKTEYEDDGEIEGGEDGGDEGSGGGEDESGGADEESSADDEE